MIIFEETLIPLHSGEASMERMPPWEPLPDDDALLPWRPPSGNGGLPTFPSTPNWETTPELPPWRSSLNDDEVTPWSSPFGNGSLPEPSDIPTWGPAPGLSTQPLPPIILPATQTKGYCNVRFLYAAIEELTVNISMNNRICIHNFQYSDVTPYYMESAGRNKIMSVTETHSGKIITQTRLFLQEGYSYTIVLINRDHGINLLVILDAPCETIGSFGSVRTVNLTAGSGPLDVFLAGIGRVFCRVGRLEVTPYRSIHAATYRAFTSESLPCVNNSDINISHTHVSCGNTQMAILDSTTFNVKHNVLQTLYLIGHPYQYPALQIVPLESDLVY